MFCPECGKSNGDELEKCAYCGADLIDNAPEQITMGDRAKEGVNWFKNTIIPFLNKYKMLLIPIIIIIFLVAGFFVTGSIVSDPERIVSKYVDGIKEQDWDGVYELLDLEESEFINQKQFTEYCKTNQNDYLNINSYNVTEATMYDYATDSNGLIKVYIVSYVTGSAPMGNSFEITLIKQEDNMWLFFPSYKISTQDMVSECTISSYPGSNVTIDGIKVECENSEALSNNNGYAIYRVPSLFHGEHKLRATHKLFDDYEEVFYVNDWNGGSISVDSLRLKSGVADDIFDIAKSDFELLCNAAIDDKDFKSSGVNYTKNSDKQRMLKDQYDDFKDRFKDDDGTGITEISLYNYSDESYQKSIGKSLTYTCYMNFDYSCTYDSSDSFYGYDSPYETSGYATITYVYEDDAWVMSSIDNYSIYY